MPVSQKVWSDIHHGYSFVTYLAISECLLMAAQNSPLITIRRRWAAVAIVAAVFAIVVLFLVQVQSSALPMVASARIAVDSPDDVPQLRGTGLSVAYEVDGIKFAGKTLGTRQPGEFVVDWYADGGLAVRQEIWSLDEPVQAWWRYRTENPKPAFERQFNKLVVDVEPSNSLSADSFSYFCANVGRSRSERLEDCLIWGFWARYGQYLLYVELRGTAHPKSSMDSVVAYFDSRMSALPRSLS